MAYYRSTPVPYSGQLSQEEIERRVPRCVKKKAENVFGWSIGHLTWSAIMAGTSFVTMANINRRKSHWTSPTKTNLIHGTHIGYTAFVSSS